MKNKPWPVVLLAILHMLEPLIGMSINYFNFNITPIDLFNITMKNNQLYVFFSTFLFPIAGIAIFMYRKWSLPIFWLVECIVIPTNIYRIKELFDYNQQAVAIFFIIGTILNLIVTTYFLLPATRKSFFDTSKHWWRTKKRFNFNVPGKILKGEDQIEVMIVNISESGVFYTCEQEVPLHKALGICFQYETANYDLQGKAVYFHKERNGYGFELVNLDRANKKSLKSLVKILADQGLITERDAGSTWQDFLNWFRGLNSKSSVN